MFMNTSQCKTLKAERAIKCALTIAQRKHKKITMMGRQGKKLNK